MIQLNQIFELYENYRKENPFFGNPSALYSPMQYIMELGGKRARPLLTLSSGLSAGGNAEDILPIAHTMEVFHNFSLVHDDIMDNARLRRGQPTVHERWDSATAILAGDNMLVKSFEILLNYHGKHKEEILNMFTRTARQVCEGQQMDMEFSQMDNVSEESYLEMIRLKTAVLLGCCAYCGASAAGASLEKANKYYEFAVSLGLAFQLDDDWLDTFGDPEKTGKKAGGDIAEGKKTWLYIKAKNLGLHVSGLYSNNNAEERIHSVTKLFREHGLDEELKKLSSFYADKAADILMHLAEMGDKTRHLADLAEMLGKRDS
jgi:geranylgeranyl diphosphate synthase, type II